MEIADAGNAGLPIRAGLHTGEVERIGDDIRGLAVHIGTRVSALAGAGDVLVSQTVKDLVVGSGFDMAVLKRVARVGPRIDEARFDALADSALGR